MITENRTRKKLPQNETPTSVMFSEKQSQPLSNVLQELSLFSSFFFCQASQPKRPPKNENENLILYSSKSPFSLLACSTILPCFLARFGLIASSFEAMVVGASFLWRWQTRRGGRLEKKEPF